MESPPEGYRKYPWALRDLDPPEEFFFGGDEAPKAAVAARVWASRNKHLGLRAATRKESGGVRVFFVKE
jgi:hypothetical protein